MEIDYIYYRATSTDEIGAQTVIEAQYFVPFFDFLLVLFVFSFTILTVWFVYHLGYAKKHTVKVKNQITVAKKTIQDLF